MLPTETLTSQLETSQDSILKEWVAYQLDAVTTRRDLIKEGELREQCKRFLGLFSRALRDNPDSDAHAWKPVKELIEELSRSRAQQGFTPSETATFVLSLKRPLFNVVQQRSPGNGTQLAEELWSLSSLVDKLGLYSMEVYQQTRDGVIQRQQQELLELSTPVVQLWEHILALPLIGTLDSARTQVVMESLLQRIVETGAKIAVIDITGVPTVDTLVAQHLMKTVAAARLMGADCIISGIRPQIAQTIVHLGVNLADITTKATLADGFQVALQRTGQFVSKGAEV
jgi:rsbT co-antagonist protein RsbR